METGAELGVIVRHTQKSGGQYWVLLLVTVGDRGRTGCYCKTHTDGDRGRTRCCKTHTDGDSGRTRCYCKTHKVSFL